VNRQEFTKIIEDTFESIKTLNVTKGEEYSGEDDALANFKRTGKAQDLLPMKVWAVFASKHYDAINSFIRNGKTLSEPIEGRIDDLIMYLLLLKGLIADEAKQSQDRINDLNLTIKYSGDTIKYDLGN
jgi:hypothetical protein